MTQNSAIEIVSEGHSQLAPYGDKSVLNELVYRVMDFHPDVRAMKGEHGEDAARQYAIQIAQTAILMGASPLPGLNEIHAWREIKKKKIVDRGKEQWISYEIIRVGPGKNYWARRGVQVAGGIHWIISPRAMSKAEKDEHGIPETEIGVMCKGCRIDQLNERMNLVSAGILSREQLLEGTAVIGVGTVTRNKDNYGNFKEQKTGRSLLWTAEKRALADFYSKACPFIPGEQISVGEGLVRNEDGTVGLNTNRLNYELVEAPRKFESMSDEKAACANEDLFGDPNDDKPSKVIIAQDFYDDVAAGDYELVDEDGVAVDDDDDYLEGELSQYKEEDDPTGQRDDKPETVAGEGAAPNQYQGVEAEIYRSSARAFWGIALKNIERYDNTEYIKDAARLLGYKKLNGDPHERVIQFRVIAKYAMNRDAGMSKADALDAIDAEPLPF